MLKFATRSAHYGKFNPRCKMQVIYNVRGTKSNMEPLFDIDWVTGHFSVTDLNHYLNLIKSAYNSELLAFKKQVSAHARENKQHGAFSNVPNYSSHKAIISAIKYELLKRSWRHELFKAIFPVRKWLVKTFSGMDLELSNDFGTLYCTPEYRFSMWHLSHTKLMKTLLSFWKRHFKWIITTLIAVTVIYLRIIGKL